MKPLVSVIIPAYNAEKTITDCLNSIYQQTFKNFEIIVVNDGSKDNTLSILNEHAAKHTDIDLHIYTIKNSGPASARNYGIFHSTGKYIAFLDSDDQWVATKLEKQIKCFEENPEIDLLGCDHFIGKSYPYLITGIKIISKHQLLFKNYFHTPCVIIKRSLLKNIRFEEKKKYSEDYFLWLQIACNNYTCAIQKDKLTILCNKAMYGQSGLSSHIWDMEKGELRNYSLLYQKHLISFPWYSAATCFSLIKYSKRILLTLFRKYIIKN